jgi:hypothetical protein
MRGTVFMKHFGVGFVLGHAVGLRYIVELHYGAAAELRARASSMALLGSELALLEDVARCRSVEKQA